MKSGFVKNNSEFHSIGSEASEEKYCGKLLGISACPKPVFASKI
tara:strand:- start:1486 stop:1617 length:132 start_codon:yes stop_codon:yes gene_type:complete